MAKEATVARESSVNPINAIRGGGGKSPEKLRTWFKNEGWAVRKADNGVLKATVNLPVQVDGENRRLLLRVYYNEGNQSVVKIEEALMYKKGSVSIEKEYSPSQMENYRGKKADEVARKVKNDVSSGHSKLVEDIKRVRAHNTTPTSSKRVSQTKERSVTQRQTKGKVYSEPRKMYVDYIDGSGDLTHVWVYARSMSEAREKVRDDFWNVKEFV